MKPHGGVGVQQADGPAQVGRVGHAYVVIQEDHALPAEHVAEQQRKVALAAHIGPPLEDGAGQQPGGLQRGKPELGRLGHVNRDQVWRPAKVGIGLTGACPIPAMQGNQRAAQETCGAGRFRQARHRADGGHDDGVDLCLRRCLIRLPEQAPVISMMIQRRGAGHHGDLDHSKSRVCGRVQSGVSARPFSTVTRLSMQKASLSPKVS